jgi:hypothetical protein
LPLARGANGDEDLLFLSDVIRRVDGLGDEGLFEDGISGASGVELLGASASSIGIDKRRLRVDS